MSDGRPFTIESHHKPLESITKMSLADTPGLAAAHAPTPAWVHDCVSLPLPW